MTFEQATAELEAKLPADVEFTLSREAYRGPAGVRVLRRRAVDQFELTVERIGVGARTFDVREASLAEAVAAAIDYARTAEAGEADEQAEADARAEARAKSLPDCGTCRNTGLVTAAGWVNVDQRLCIGDPCPDCDRGIPF